MVTNSQMTGRLVAGGTSPLIPATGRQDAGATRPPLTRPLPAGSRRYEEVLRRDALREMNLFWRVLIAAQVCE